MVATRSSQGGHKRRRSSSEAPSEASTAKIRKTARRRFATPDGQLLDEQRDASIERFQHHLSHETESRFITPVVRPILPKSRQTRLSLPTNLQTPPDIRTEPLRIAIARENERRRRQTEGLPAGPDSTDIYIDPADLDIDASQIKNSDHSIVVRTQHAPIALTTHLSPNARREDSISSYEEAIRDLTEQKAALATKVQILELGIRSLGFGEDGMDDEDICAAIRTECDLVRAQEEEFDIDVPVNELNNQELLRLQPNIMRSLLLDIESYASKLANLENLLTFTDAQYKGVLGKLAEREERSTELQTQLQKIDQQLDSRTRHLNAEQSKTAKLTSDNDQLVKLVEEREQELARLEDAHLSQDSEIAELRTTCDNLHKDVLRLRDTALRAESEHAKHIADIEADSDAKVDLMVEELEQEHYYRAVAEEEIASKDAAYTKLQIKFQALKSDLDGTENELAQATELLNKQDDDINNLNTDLHSKDTYIESLEQKLNGFEQKTDRLEEDIKRLSDQSDQDKQTIAQHDAALQDAVQQVGLRDENLQQLNIEINELRVELFGTQHERDRLIDTLQASNEEREGLCTDIARKTAVIGKLEDDIEALNRAMDSLTQEKDSVIESKHAKLDEREATIEDQARTVTQQKDELDAQGWQIVQKDLDITALREENIRCMADREELRISLAQRGKDVVALKGIISQLVADAERDEVVHREQATQKAIIVKAAQDVLGCLRTESDPTSPNQDVRTSVLVKSRSVRDSGYLGSDLDDELLLTDAE